MTTHGPIINNLQKFPIPSFEQAKKFDIIRPGFIEYQPWNDMYDLQGKRRNLILYPRAHLKTTINCVAHTIQWILNYPEMSLIIFQSTSEKIKDFIREIKQIFMYNDVFRSIYPDYVPHKHLRDWGNKTEFFVPNEEDRSIRIEKYGLRRNRHPSVIGMSLDEGTSGIHVDVIKFSDIVETNNSKTQNQLNDVIHNYRMAQHLLVKPDGWMDVEGTRYHFDDLYGDIIDRWLGIDKGGGKLLPRAVEAHRKKWNILVRGCWKKDYSRKGPGFIPKFTPDELEDPDIIDLVDATGRKVPIWSRDRTGGERFTYDSLMAMRAEDQLQFACQLENCPDRADDKALFPMARKNLWISRKDFLKVPIYEHTVTVDTADTQTTGSDYSVICVCAWGGNGRCYVHDIRVGKYTPSEIIDNIFDVNKKYRPTSIKIEKTSFVRGMENDLRRREELENIKLPVDLVPRETAISKQDRIRLTLQPMWKREVITIVQQDGDKTYEHPYVEALVRQLRQFPRGKDDILDALADQFQGRTAFSRLLARPDINNEYFMNSDGTLTEEGLNYALRAGANKLQQIQANLFENYLFNAPEDTQPTTKGMTTGVL